MRLYPLVATPIDVIVVTFNTIPKLTAIRGTVDHPHGGGRGKSKGNRHPVSPWGVPTKSGYKTSMNPFSFSSNVFSHG